MTRIFFVSKLIAFFLLTLLFFLSAYTVALANVTTIVLPNGGECLTVGEAYTIEFSWSGEDVEHVALYYRTDGAQPTHLDSSTIKHPINVPQQGTTWNWTPGSSHISETGRIWVDGHGNGHNSLVTWDNSDADFAVRADCSPPPAEGGGGGSAPRTFIPTVAPVFSFLPEPEPPLPRGGGPVSYPPTVEFTKSPAMGEVVYDTTVVSFSADDLNNIDRKETFGISNNPVSLFYASGKNTDKRTLIIEGLASSTSYTWNVRDVPVGNDYRIIAEATDKSGLVGRAITPAFSINNAIPSSETYSRAAIISWRTPTPTYSFVEYGEQIRAHVVSARKTTPEAKASTEHLFVIEGLSPDTTYYFRATNSVTRPSQEGWSETQEYFDPNLEAFSYQFKTKSAPATEVFPASQVFILPGKTTMLISWVNSGKESFETIVTRLSNRFPKNPKDGNVVFRGDVPNTDDGGLAPGQEYYYSIFRIESDSNYSLPVFVRAQTNIMGSEEAPAPPQNRSDTPKELRVGSFSSEPKGESVSLRWKNPDNPHFLGVQIVRNTESLPAHPFDGTIVFRGRADGFTDKGLVPEKRYLYGVFAFDWNNTFHAGSFTSGVPETVFILSALPSFNSAPPLSLPEPRSLSEVQSQINTLFEKVKEISAAIQTILSPETPVSPTPPTLQEQGGQAVYTVEVTESGFVPSVLVVKQGDTVKWVQRSVKRSWPASDEHPTHRLYPESGGCIGSVFDSCRTLSVGDVFSFRFNEKGVWRYHDHLEPLHVGTITVQ